jgi:adenylate cyclase
MLTLTISVGLLVFLAAGLVLLVQWSTSRQILSDLGGRIALRNLEIMELGVHDHLDPARQVVDHLGRLIESGAYDLSEADRISDLLAGSAAAVPQIGALMVADENLRAIRLARDPVTGRYRLDQPDLSGNPRFVEEEREVRLAKGSYWGSPFYNPDLEITFINVRRPLRRDGKYIGLIVAAVTTNELSKLASEMGEMFGSRTFVLYGGDRVLAHPNLASDHPGRSVEDPVVPLDLVGDRVLARIDQAVPVQFLEFASESDAEALQISVDNVLYFVLRQSLHQFGDTPFVIGSYRRASEVDAPLRLLYLSGLIGLAFLLVSLICVIWLSRQISLPIRRVSSGVAKVGTLDFDQVEEIKPSLIREVNDLATAFNKMLGGLRSFETYVPRKLVARLIEEGQASGAQSEERELTIMFTDIAGFTSMCEGMDAKEVAAFINHHLKLLAECVENEGGTIDKYIGDALMAFWGAPERIENTAPGACRAALIMKKAISADNKVRLAAGIKPVRLRIGIHTGPLVVGNIGAPSRVNYTVVGDTVNTAQRLEALGKEVGPDAEVTILISATTRAQLPVEFTTTAVGSHLVKGKSERIDVYKLLGQGVEA